MNTPTRVKEPESPALPRVLWLPLGLVAGSAAVIVVALGVLFAGQSTGTDFDLRVEPAMRSSATGPVGYDLAWIVGSAGDPIPAGVLALLLSLGCLWLGRRRLAAVAFAGLVLTGVVTTVGKHVVGRTIHDGNLSFPSGHTANLTAMAMVLGLLLVDLRQLRARASASATVLTAAVVGGVAMAWSSTALNVHYPTDCLAGLCVALVIIPLVAWLIDGLIDRVADRRGEEVVSGSAASGGVPGS